MKLRNTQVEEMHMAGYRERHGAFVPSLDAPLSQNL